MSAIEMMDPKMDAGMIGNQVNRKVLNFEQAIKVLVYKTKIGINIVINICFLQFLLFYVTSILNYATVFKILSSS